SGVITIDGVVADDISSNGISIANISSGQIRLSNFNVNNASSVGVILDTLTDLVLDGALITNAGAHGLFVTGCTRPGVRNITAIANGQVTANQSGISFNNSTNGYIHGCDCSDPQGTATQDVGLTITVTSSGIHVRDLRGTGNITALLADNGTSAIVTTLADDATPTVDGFGPGVHLFKTGGITSITDFDDGVVGQTIKILAAHSVKITDGAPIILAGGADYDMTDSDTLTLTMYDDQVWQEDSRSVN
ncbi:hypothetical protein LCGC14_2829590, partial [marine sediment metagenome]